MLGKANHSASNNAPRYEDLYKNNYYKKYTTNYYGVSRDDLKQTKNTVKEEPSYIISPNKVLLGIAILLLVLAIFLIILLSLIKNLINQDSVKIEELDTSTPQYQNPSLPYITFGMHYYEIRDRLNSPSSIVRESDRFYAYWGTSYILFDNKKTVIDWENNGGYFRTPAQTGKEAIMWQDLYESVYNTN